MGRLLAFFFGFILILVLLVVLLTHGHNKSATPVRVVTLTDYADTTATVSFTTDGIVNGDDMHRGVRITIAQDRRVVEIYAGYDHHVIDSHTFYNNQQAYTVFLKSLNNAGFLAKNKKSKVPDNPDGQCALGFRYMFVLENEGDDVSNLWTSSCGANDGNWAGNFSTVKTLFQDQIPSYGKLTNNLNLEKTSI